MNIVWIYEFQFASNCRSNAVHEPKSEVHRLTSLSRVHTLLQTVFPVECNSLQGTATPLELLASNSRFVRATEEYEGHLGEYDNNEDICKHFHSCFKMATRIQVNPVAWRS
jgi:hypothetical protein